MHFIPRIDELLVAAPYSLDTNLVPFQSNVFLLPAKHKKLQKRIDEQLNAAMPNGPFRYTVPKSVQRVFLAFYRYDRVQSTIEMEKGWMGYNEAMIGFLVLRKPHPDLDDAHPLKNQPPELVTYLGVVYIGDLAMTGPVGDPYTIPIIIGREAYGLPKNPGRIFYDPTSAHLPNGPKVEIWDAPPGGGDLSLVTAIRVSRLLASSLQRRPVVPQPPPERPRARLPIPDEVLKRLDERSEIRRPDEAQPERSWEIFADLLGVGESLELGSAAGLIDDPNAVLVEVPDQEEPALAWINLLWRTKLVGLKEFPAPEFPPVGGGFSDACYQAIVESPLEETPEHLLEFPKPLYWDQQVEFPLVERVDLVKKFGIQTTVGRRVHVGTDAMFYQQGSLLFADPAKVNVWNPL